MQRLQAPGGLTAAVPHQDISSIAHLLLPYIDGKTSETMNLVVLPLEREAEKTFTNPK